MKIILITAYVLVTMGYYQEMQETHRSYESPGHAIVDAALWPIEMGKQLASSKRKTNDE